MNAQQARQSLDGIVESTWLKLTSRVAIIIASLFVPFVTFQATQVLRDVRDTRDTLIAISYRVTALENEVSKTGDDRYRSQDAVRDFRLRDLKDQQQDQRIDENKNDIDRIQRSGGGR